jgi:hypothetical protein
VKAWIREYTKGIHVTWEPGRGNDADKFSIRLAYDSLLAAIWNQFASDTSGVPWRLCPHHQRFFYPPRKDRFFCESWEQVAYSNAKYELERKKKRLKGRGRGKTKC